MKTIYYADHKNIKGNELVYVEQRIDALENISYAVILDKPYTDNDRMEYVLGLFGNRMEAVDFANNYETE